MPLLLIVGIILSVYFYSYFLQYPIIGLPILYFLYKNRHKTDNYKLAWHFVGPVFALAASGYVIHKTLVDLGFKANVVGLYTFIGLVIVFVKYISWQNDDDDKFEKAKKQKSD